MSKGHGRLEYEIGLSGHIVPSTQTEKDRAILFFQGQDGSGYCSARLRISPLSLSAPYLGKKAGSRDIGRSVMGGLGGYGIARKRDLTQIIKKRAQRKRSGSR